MLDDFDLVFVAGQSTPVRLGIAVVFVVFFCNFNMWLAWYGLHVQRLKFRLESFLQKRSGLCVVVVVV